MPSAAWLSGLCKRPLPVLKPSAHGFDSLATYNPSVIRVGGKFSAFLLCCIFPFGGASEGASPDAPLCFHATFRRLRRAALRPNPLS
ncbi:hypothetical protein HRbin17_00450 [bacterium HR17]|uniref:Uncharacterized protein n=1 Tax=Candidatus Fervidibacter japonicus TaxID=2035412 RepID=A0A2H5X9V8_9BACT|nr:hypothetical protein HRbin17_00450 [bacterium HR17]